MKASNTNIEYLLENCAQQNVQLNVNGGELEVLFDDYPSDDLIAGLREFKEDILQYIKQKNRISDTKIATAKRTSDSIYPTSYAQNRLWFIDKLEGENSSYNMSFSLRIKGELKHDLVEDVINTIIARHESFRTCFLEKEGESFQKVISEIDLKINQQDISLHSEDQQLALIAKYCNQPFSLKQAPLLRVAIFNIATDECILALSMHHIISDGWSMGVFLDEFSLLYNNACKGTEQKLPALNIQYVDYSAWQKKQLSGEALENELGYWKKQLTNVPQLHQLPLDFQRPCIQNQSAHSHQQILSAGLSENINKFCEHNDVTPFILLETSFALLLSMMSAEKDIVIGTPVAGRNNQQIENLIGFFVNTVVINTNINQQLSFTELLQQNRQNILNNFDHQTFPFDLLIEYLKPPRNLAYSPLVQIMFAMQTNELSMIKLDNLQIQELPYQESGNKFDLELNIVPENNGFHLRWNYKTSLFKPETIKKSSQRFTFLLEQILQTPDLPITELNLLLEEEKQCLNKWNQTQRIYPQQLCFHELFEQQVLKDPMAMAISGHFAELSYQQLNQQANQLAHFLLEAGLKKEQAVAIYLERSAELFISIMAILKAGGVVLAIDSDYPVQRVDMILADSQAGFIISDCKKLDNLLVTDDIKQIDLQASQPILQSMSEHNINKHDVGLTAHNLAYLIYTSGSTGVPKAAMIEHHSLNNLSQSQQHLFNINNQSKILQFASISFDAAVSEWATAFASGATLNIIEKNNISDVHLFLAHLSEHDITHLTLPPAYLVTLPIKTNDQVKTLIMAGESLDLTTAQHASQLFEKAQLINAYGATENTICATVKLLPNELDKLSSTLVPIGNAIDNTLLYVVNENMKLCPIGTAGELCIGGQGIARGYLNRPELTAERFIGNPFISDNTARLYKTGDRVCWQAGGQLQYLGRLDQQLKIRGHRIEPGEIESQLQLCHGVKESHVLAKGEGASAQLVAYIVADTQVEIPLDTSDIKPQLQQLLPEYMLPSHIHLLEAMPLTSNGKIDRAALLAYELKDDSVYIAAKGELEQRLSALWCDLLDLSEVSVISNFFELGGHSLLATRLLSQIREEFGQEVSLRDLFQSPTIRGLAKVMRDSSDSAIILPALTRVMTDEPMPLSYAQQRLWFIDQLEQSSAQYNMAASYRMKGVWNQQVFDAVIEQLLKRHQVLRTQFIEVDGVAYQSLRESYKLPITHHDLSAVNKDKQQSEVERYIAEDERQSFDLHNDVLLRCHVLKLSSQEHVVVFNMHHIASDGWSIEILITEFNQLYSAYNAGQDNPLPELAIQYTDYAHWQRQWLQGSILEEQLSYWTQHLAGLPQVHGLPLDKTRSQQQSFAGANQQIRLGSEISKPLKALCKKHDVTLFMLMQSAFAVLLSRWSNEQDIVMGTPIAGRTHAATESLIGFFVNTLVLRTEVPPEQSFSDLLLQNRQSLLDAFSHQHIPFEMLVEALQPERSLSHSPLVQVLLNVSKQSSKLESNLDSLAVSPVFSSETDTIAKYELTLYVDDSGDDLFITWNYNTALFEHESIVRMSDAFAYLLEILPDNLSTNIAQLPLIKKPQILVSKGSEFVFKENRIEQLFAHQVQDKPDSVALLHNGKSISYQQLNQRVNAYAGFLVEENIGLHDRVGFQLEKSIDMVAAIIATLKIGASYIPLDISLPVARVEQIITDANMKLLFAVKTATKITGCRVLVLSDCHLKHMPEVSSQLEAAFKQAHLNKISHIIYTSGSTGKPKGVLGTHLSLLNRVQWMQQTMPYTDDETVSHITSMAFIRAVWELWQPLSQGVTVNIIDEEKIKDGQQLLEEIKQDNITRIVTTPTYAHTLLQLDAEQHYLNSLKYWFISGEPLDSDLQNKLTTQLKCCKFYNLYGSTECMSDIAFYEMTKNNNTSSSVVPIGKAIANTRVYILDEFLQQIPHGVVGEICVAGASLAQAYNTDIVDNKQFVETKEYGRLYRTGDLGRFDNAENLLCLGRKDRQIKIRGYRIETTEIENVLLSVNQVKSVHVCTAQTSQNTLVAFIEAMNSSKETLPDQKLVESCQLQLDQLLPKYMHPEKLLIIEQMPLLKNGKIDRNHLFKSDVVDSFASTYRAPYSTVQQTLCEIWQEVLDVERVGIDDDFFALGGHSLLLMIVKNQIEKRLKIAVDIKTLFSFSTIERLSAAYQLANNIVDIKQEIKTNKEYTIGEL